MKSMGIGQSLQLSYDGNLEIAAGDFYGSTCKLLFSLRDRSLPWMGGRYEVGQEIVYGQYVVKVIGMDYDSYDRPYVNLGIREVEDTGLEWQVTMRAEGEGPYEIPSHTQLIYCDDVLLVGAGDFAVGVYDEESGRYDETLSDDPWVDTAALWLAVRDGSEPPRREEIHAGREVVYGGYQIRVLEVRSDFFREAEGISRTDFVPSVRISIDVLQDAE